MKWFNRWRHLSLPQAVPIQPDDDAPLGLDEDPFTEPVVWEITDTIDLHHVAPREIRAVVTAYLEEVHSLGWWRVRIIHGKGKGVQRDNIRRILKETAFVGEIFDAPDASGWGATIVLLLPKADEEQKER